MITRSLPFRSTLCLALLLTFACSDNSTEAPATTSNEVPQSNLAAIPADIAASLREIGSGNNIAGTAALYTPDFSDGWLDDLVVIRDQAYGPAPRNVLDVMAWLVQSEVPMLATYGEYDGDQYKDQFQLLRSAAAQAGKQLETLYLQNHSHMSETYAVGTADDSLTAPVLDFINRHLH